MEELATVSIISRFLQAFADGFVLSVKDLGVDILLVILTLVYQYHSGRLSVEAWRENVWEASMPWVWLICLVAAKHVWMATKKVYRELQQDLHRSRRPFIILTDGEQERVPSNYQLKLGGIAAACFSVLTLLAIFSWQLAKNTDTAGIFAISDGSFSFVNMTQRLTTQNTGDWWVSYQSYAGDTASPVALMQYVEITNLQSVPETIRSYAMAIRTEDCGWTYLSPIPLRSVAVWWTYMGLDHAIPMDFHENGLDIVLEKPIPAFGTVTGSWLFDSKVRCDVPEGSKVQYRLALTTFDGKRFEYTTPETVVSNKSHSPGNTEGHLTGPAFHVPPGPRYIDISKLYRRLYSDPIPKE